MYFFIPGNPGIKCFYQDLLDQLQAKLKREVIFCSHFGHETKETTYYNIEQQVEHHYQQIIMAKQKCRKIYLIGHSFGGYVATRLLSLIPEIRKVYLIAPTIYRLNNTKRGKEIAKILQLPIRPTSTALSLTLLCLSEDIQINIVKKIFNIDSLERLPYKISRHHIRAIAYLARDELLRITALPEEIVKRKQIKIIFGKDDPTIDPELYDLLTRNKVSYTIRDIPHTFCLDKEAIQTVVGFIGNYFYQ